jgi:hypothetical protein
MNTDDKGIITTKQEDTKPFSGFWGLAASTDQPNYDFLPL